MGWTLQKPRVGKKRCSRHIKDYLKPQFDAGEESDKKADPQQVSVDMLEQKRTNVYSRERNNWHKPGAIIPSGADCSKRKTSKQAHF